MKKYLIFNQNYFDIPLQDMPGKGNLIVCRDHQKRLGESTWMCLEQLEADVKLDFVFGLFWEQKHAEFFAKSLCENKNEE